MCFEAHKKCSFYDLPTPVLDYNLRLSVCIVFLALNFGAILSVHANLFSFCCYYVASIVFYNKLLLN